jgi:hypothetical protein
MAGLSDRLSVEIQGVRGFFILVKMLRKEQKIGGSSLEQSCMVILGLDIVCRWHHEGERLIHLILRLLHVDCNHKYEALI